LEKAVEGTVKKERYAYLKELRHRELDGVVGGWFQRLGNLGIPDPPPDKEQAEDTVPGLSTGGLHRFFAEDREGRRKIEEVLIMEESWRKPIHRTGDRKEVVHVGPRRSNFTAGSPHQSPGPGGYTKPPAAPAAPWRG